MRAPAPPPAAADEAAEVAPETAELPLEATDEAPDMADEAAPEAADMADEATDEAEAAAELATFEADEAAPEAADEASEEVCEAADVAEPEAPDAPDAPAPPGQRVCWRAVAADSWSGQVLRRVSHARGQVGLEDTHDWMQVRAAWTNWDEAQTQVRSVMAEQPAWVAAVDAQVRMQGLIWLGSSLERS